MKKVMFFMAIAGMFAFAACNNNAPVEEATDTTNLEQVMPEEETTDSTAMEAPVEEGEVAPAEIQ